MLPSGTLVADRLWKRFRADQRRTLLRDELERLRGARHGDRRGWRWALRDITFDIEPGDSVGMVGTNGSGKTTLLKILAGVMYPYAGRMEVSGRLGPLIDLRAGLHPDLTGRENVYISGSLFGLSPQGDHSAVRRGGRLRGARGRDRAAGQVLLERDAAPARVRHRHRDEAGHPARRRGPRRGRRGVPAEVPRPDPGHDPVRDDADLRRSRSRLRRGNVQEGALAAGRRRPGEGRGARRHRGIPPLDRGARGGDAGRGAQGGSRAADQGRGHRPAGRRMSNRWTDRDSSDHRERPAHRRNAVRGNQRGTGHADLRDPARDCRCATGRRRLAARSRTFRCPAAASSRGSPSWEPTVRSFCRGSRPRTSTWPGRIWIRPRRESSASRRSRCGRHGRSTGDREKRRARGRTRGTFGSVARGLTLATSVVLTYRRPRHAARVVRSLLEDEGLPASQVIVVVNGEGGLDDPTLERAITMLTLEENIGPAGGFARAFRFVRGITESPWIYACEDDTDARGPASPRLPRLIERVEAFEREVPGPPVGVVLTSGWNVDRRTGRTTRHRVQSSAASFEEVDFGAWDSTLVSRRVIDAGIAPGRVPLLVGRGARLLSARAAGRLPRAGRRPYAARS